MKCSPGRPLRSGPDYSVRAKVRVGSCLGQVKVRDYRVRIRVGVMVTVMVRVRVRVRVR